MSEYAHVYVMLDGDGFVKIGFSTNPATRLESIRSKRASHVSLEWESPARSDAQGVERASHSLLNHAHVGEEWFRVDVQTAINVVNGVISEAGSALLSAPKRAARSSRAKDGSRAARIGFCVTRAIKEDAKRAARERGITLSNFVEMLIKAKLNSSGRNTEA